MKFNSEKKTPCSAYMGIMANMHTHTHTNVYVNVNGCLFSMYREKIIQRRFFSENKWKAEETNFWFFFPEYRYI